MDLFLIVPVLWRLHGCWKAYSSRVDNARALRLFYVYLLMAVGVLFRILSCFWASIVDKNEIDRALAVPLDMLCSARYARLREDYHPTAALDQEGEEEWSGFTYTGPLFNLGSSVGRQAADNGRTSPVVWGLTARILAEYLTLLATVQAEEGSEG